MPPLPVSVIVVSRHRADALQRCLAALFLQDHSAMELIVVADPEAAVLTEKALHAAGQAARILGFDVANISAARNLGLIHATGDVVAFIDDDAVAEPSWLSRLTQPFADAKVIAATGFVRGRNGISYQWRAGEVDNLAQDHALDVPGTTVLQGSASRAVKTQGTNCAFRRAPLLAIGGFDPAYRFYLDEADVNLRLASLGPTAIVPDAEVQHGFHASAHRRSNRVPKTLFDIAASTAVFLRRHAPQADLGAARQRLLQREADRIARHRAARRLGAKAAADLLQSLSDGWAEGQSRVLAALPPLVAVGSAAFLPVQGCGPRRGVVLTGRFWQRRRLLAKARICVQAGQIVTVICLSPTPLAHRATFHPDGFWLQTGGIFGRSLRDAPRTRLIGFARRVAEEARRIAKVRPVN